MGRGHADVRSAEFQALEPRLLLSSIVVTTVADVVDGTTTSIPDLIANPGPDTKISLREAVIAANNTAGDDDITLMPGTYALTITGSGEDLAATGDLDIDGGAKLTITGAGASSTKIDATGLGDRVFHVEPSTTGEFRDITITGGSVTGDVGGGIYNQGWTVVVNSTISGNVASTSGGGIYHNSFYGGVTIDNSTVSGNEASGFGGGMRLWGSGNLVTNSTISGNVSTSNHGGGLVWQVPPHPKGRTITSIIL